jgi:hypothetical protein
MGSDDETQINIIKTTQLSESGLAKDPTTTGLKTMMD